ncbi:MAG: MFS transporter [Desertimonas sp.]
MPEGGHVSSGRGHTVDRTWPDSPGLVDVLSRPRDDLVRERGDTEAGVFVQDEGPFLEYRRRIEPVPGGWRERTTFRWSLPWFAWLFLIPVRWTLGRRFEPPGSDHRSIHDGSTATPAWAPPDRLDPRQLRVLGLLAAASMSSAFINTLFTQTVNFAADDFGVGDSGVGVAGAIVRAGIILVIPLALLADRWGRRRIITITAVAAPAITALGAVAPSFPLLVATQTIGRPLGLAMDFLIAVVATEEMPRNSRAYAISILAMASGFGAGIAVLALPLADLDESSWRLVYAVTLIWLTVAVSIARRLPETTRFQRPHVVAPPLHRRRFAVVAAAAFLGNVFVAPVSLFQNGYLEDQRGYSATLIAIFTLATATPAALGLIVGGRLADTVGRRRMVAVCLPLATAALVVSYSVGGAIMWGSVFIAGVLGGLTYPALAVYRTELFPTGNRGRAAGLLTASALLGGIGGLLAMGWLLDAGWSHGQVTALLALGQLAVVVIVLTSYPETAHQELEDLNPEDRLIAPAGS